MQEDEKLFGLVRAVQAKTGAARDQAFDQLDRLIRPIAQRFFLNKRFPSDEVPDLTQLAMLRVFKGIGTFRGESPVGPWLFEILTNVFRNELRRRHSMKREGVEVALEGTATDDSGELVPRFPQLVTDEEDPLTALLRSEGGELFRQALGELPKQMRRVCLLRYIQGRKYREIATLLGISIETVKAHLHQAKHRIEAKLGKAAAVRRSGR